MHFFKKGFVLSKTCKVGILRRFFSSPRLKMWKTVRVKKGVNINTQILDVFVCFCLDAIW